MMQVRPYVILGASERERLTELVTTCLTDWCRQWLANGTPRAVADAAEPIACSYWLVADAGELGTVAICTSKGWGLQAGALFGGQGDGADANPVSELSHALCEAAFEALVQSLCHAPCKIERRQLRPGELTETPGAEFLALEFAVGSGEAKIQMIGWPAWVHARLDRPGKLEHSGTALIAPARAMEDETLAVKAVVGEAEVPIEELSQLRLGDVLVVDRRIDQPLTIFLDGGEAFAAGHLFAAKGKKVVQLLRLA